MRILSVRQTGARALVSVWCVFFHYSDSGKANGDVKFPRNVVQFGDSTVAPLAIHDMTWQRYSILHRSRNWMHDANHIFGAYGKQLNTKFPVEKHFICIFYARMHHLVGAIYECIPRLWLTGNYFLKGLKPVSLLRPFLCVGVDVRFTIKFMFMWIILE